MWATWHIAQTVIQKLVRTLCTKLFCIYGKVFKHGKTSTNRASRGYLVEFIEIDTYTRERALTRRLFWCLLPELRNIERNKNQNNTRVSAGAVCHSSTYLVVVLTRERRFSHINTVSRSPWSHYPDDVSNDCCWPHNYPTIVTRAREKWYLTR